jgi:hypothetical protein
MPILVQTNQPSARVLIISLIIVVVAILGHIARIPNITPYHFWIAVLGYAVLMIGTLYKI